MLAWGMHRRFLVGGTLGAGSHGTVYAALDRASGVPVALKLLAVAGEGTREVQALRLLAHMANCKVSLRMEKQK